MSEQANAAKRAEGLRACADGIDKYPDKEFALKCMRHAADRMEELETELAAAQERIAKLKEQYTPWWARKRSEIDKLREVTEQRDRLAEALQKLADCDWVITLPDRMDGVRAIAREALAAVKGGSDE